MTKQRENAHKASIFLADFEAVLIILSNIQLKIPNLALLQPRRSATLRNIERPIFKTVCTTSLCMYMYIYCTYTSCTLQL